MSSERLLIGWKQIAAYLRCSIATAERRARDGLPVFRVGGSVRAHADDIDRWLSFGNGGYKQLAGDGDAETIVLDGNTIPDTLTSFPERKRGIRYAVIPLGADAAELRELQFRLKEAEGRNRWLLERVPVWIWEADERLVIGESNLHVFELLGYRPEEVIGYSPLEYLVYPGDAAAWEREISVLKTKGAIIKGFRCRFLHRDGTTRWLETDAEPIFTTGGAWGGVRGVCRDVSARVLLERELTEARNYLQSVLLGSREAIITTDAEGRVRIWNDGATTLFGYGREEAFGRNLISLIYPAGARPEFQTLFARVMASGGGWMEEEAVRRRKGGAPLTVSATYSAIMNAYGEVVGLSVISRDITEKKAAAEVLVRERRAFGLIAEAATDNRGLPIVCDYVLKGLVETLGYDFGAIRLWEPASQHLILQAAVGVGGEIARGLVAAQHIDERGVVSAYVARTLTPLFAPDVTRAEIPAELSPRIADFKAKAVVAWPLRDSAGGLLGVMYLAGRYPKNLRPEDKTFFETIAGMFALMLERKLGEDALKGSEETARALMNASDSIAVLLDSELRTLAVNNRAEDLLGTVPDIIIGQYFGAYIPGDLAAAFIPKLREAVTHGRPVRFNYSAEGRCIDVNVHPITAVGGDVIRLAVYARDVTDSVKAEQALRQSEMKYRRIVETAGEGIWLTDAHGVTTFVNDRLTRMLGYGSGEILGTSIYKYFDEESRRRFNRVLAGGVRASSDGKDYRFVTSDGAGLWALMNCSVILGDHGERQGILAMLTDISARKAAEAAVERHARMSENLFGLARALNEARGMDELLGGAARSLNNNPAAVAGGFYLLDIARGLFCLKRSFGRDTSSLGQTELDAAEIKAIRDEAGGGLLWFDGETGRPSGGSLNTGTTAKKGNMVVWASLRARGDDVGVLKIVLRASDAETLAFIEMAAIELSAGIQRLMAENALHSSGEDARSR